MPFASLLRSGVRLAAVTPALWLYGLISAALGGAILISALLAAIPRYDDPVGHGLLGWALLAAVIVVSFTVEAAACRAAVRREGLLATVKDAARLLPEVAKLTPMLVLVAVLFCLTVAVPVFAFLRTFLAAILLAVFPFAVNMTVILGSAIAALALLVPAWAFAPLAVRGVGIHDRDAPESVGDALTILGERPGALLLLGLISVALDAALLIGGAKLGASDPSLTSRLHVLAGWHGSHAGAGVVFLALTALVATLKAGLWTALYLDVAEAQRWGDSAREPASHGALVRLATLARGAAHNLISSPVPILLAAFIVLIGVPTAADLLTLYHLVPAPGGPSPSRVADQIPGGGRTLLKLFFPAVFASICCSTALVAATKPPADALTAAFTGLRRVPSVIGGLAVMFAGVALVGLLVLVGVLFAMALVVQYAKGLDTIADQFGKLVGIAIVSVAVILTPFVARAAVFEKLSPTKAAGRGFDLAGSEPVLVFLAFLLTISLEVLRGPIAHWAGLITSGWAELYALGGQVHPPITRTTLAYSAAALIVATLALAFQAHLWTEVYKQAIATEANVAEIPAAPPVAGGKVRKDDKAKKTHAAKRAGH